MNHKPDYQLNHYDKLFGSSGFCPAGTSAGTHLTAVSSLFLSTFLLGG